MIVSADLRTTLLGLLAQRGPSKTICPSEVARALSPKNWRELMPAVREVGVELVAEGQIVAQQRGQMVDPKTVRGPIRYGQAESAVGNRGDAETVSGSDG
ncbi:MULTISPECIES: DUF3253 domain-containing protein [Cyanophyceae]|uniref:DUF3253 domain-containing protein n=1 Tax=Cyanophyceae TaxID=3028117 RepID=UPI001683A566|nr:MULTISPECIES: DUF3253 domain-containing protein [Cyanophyceae]MBD1918740.1 DUF3253 domain-containing protein [Phormidium sp. FACHB-77]MBD2033393.1 DUF3253 domain-containing protein [Phormidium sp. FACHB-322]MBD2053892.1 DUF3253 domain-containing protein [Leptolyngbya sp. FACHB-60]